MGQGAQETEKASLDKVQPRPHKQPSEWIR